jgi:hypothetical protein
MACSPHTMSLRICANIRDSYGANEQGCADKLFRLLNIELRRHQLPEYPDPHNGEGTMRGLPVGTVGASALRRLAYVARTADLTFSPDDFGGERWIALPRRFPGKLSIMVGRWCFFPVSQCFFSLHNILTELTALAPLLEIPIQNGSLEPSTIEKISNCDPLHECEPPGHFEVERGNWLDLYLAVQYGLENDVPLVIEH